ncbi:nucleotide exchange factor GrpE [Candidatus Gracilibacteria bacterium]|nr:nucleotide exchange factor GrpE [Candidatus Gracilibacteria bacterium]
MKRKESQKKKELKATSVLVQKIEEMETIILELKSKLSQGEVARLRALADLQNYQRRETKNKKNWSGQAVCEFLKGVLPNFLELQLGVEHSENEDFQKVVEKFFEKLSVQGFEKIMPKAGEKVDPEIHEVVMVGEGKSGEVVKVLEPGWSFGKTIIAPAKVSAA